MAIGSTINEPKAATAKIVSAMSRGLIAARRLTSRNSASANARAQATPTINGTKCVSRMTRKSGHTATTLELLEMRK